MRAYDWYLIGFTVGRGVTWPYHAQGPDTAEDRSALALGVSEGSAKHADLRSLASFERALAVMVNKEPTLSLNKEEVQKVVQFIDRWANPTPVGPVTAKMKAFLAK